MAELTAKELKRICRELQLYSVPELNDKLYLHYKGYKKIESLDEYTGLKVLYLEGNGPTAGCEACNSALQGIRGVLLGFRKIEGLDKLTQLRCLYLQENQISVMENLDALTDLDALNLNQNLVRRVEGLSGLKKLNTLLLQGNKLGPDVSALEGLRECPSIGVLDLSKNELADGEAVLQLIVQALPGIKVLYLKDNPLVENLANYRRRVIAALPTLTYLDDRPVFEEERRAVEAWSRGGKAAEQEERQRIEAEKRARELRNYEAFEKMLSDARSSAGPLPPGSMQAGGRIIEEQETKEEDAGSDDEAAQQADKQASDKQPPELEDAEESDGIVAQAVRATTKLSITHTSAGAAAPAAATTGSAAIVTPASAANAASARAVLSLEPKSKPSVAAGGKKMLIEMVDDEETAAAAPEEKQLPPQPQRAAPSNALIQELD